MQIAMRSLITSIAISGVGVLSGTDATQCACDGKIDYGDLKSRVKSTVPKRLSSKQSSTKNSRPSSAGWFRS
jgi:hypothetical protein